MKQKNMKVTLFELWLLGACKTDRKLFKKIFGYSAVISPENMKKAIDGGLDVEFYCMWLRSMYTRSRKSREKTRLLRRLYAEAMATSYNEVWEKRYETRNA